MPPCCAACPECASLVQSNALRRGGFCSHSKPRARELPVACCAESSAGKCNFWSLSLSMLSVWFLACFAWLFPTTLLCYFRTIHQLSLGDAGVGSLEHSFTFFQLHCCPSLLTAFPSLFFCLKISLNAKGHMTSGVSSKKYFCSTSLCWLAFFYIVWLLRFKMWFS